MFTNIFFFFSFSFSSAFSAFYSASPHGLSLQNLVASNHFPDFYLGIEMNLFAGFMYIRHELFRWLSDQKEKEATPQPQVILRCRHYCYQYSSFHVKFLRAKRNGGFERALVGYWLSRPLAQVFFVAPIS